MKVPPRNVATFCAAPPADVKGILVYGPNEGLVRSLAKKAVESVVDDSSDPFRVTALDPSAVREDPALLADEANALSLTGGRRVVRVSGATDQISGALESIFENSADAALVIVEAGQLTPRSSLRRLFEGAESGGAVACYEDDQRDLGRVTNEFFRAREIRISADAREWLAERLGGDRGQVENELEKLAQYAGPGGELDLGDLQALVGDAAAASLDDLCRAVGFGNPGRVDRALQRAFADGVAAVQALRAVSRHFIRLESARAKMREGASAEQALNGLRPPVFFKQKESFRQQLETWSPERLSDALVLLCEAEAACKYSAAPVGALCTRALFSVASGARSGARRA